MEEVGKILPGVFKSQIRRADPPLVELLTPFWPRVAGKAIARFSRPLAFESGILTLGCSCLSWTAQLRGMREEVRAKINDFLGGVIVKTLKVLHVPDLAPLESAGEKPADRAAPVTEKLSRADGAADLDDEISETLGRSFAKYFARKGKRAN